MLGICGESIDFYTQVLLHQLYVFSFHAFWLITTGNQDCNPSPTGNFLLIHQALYLYPLDLQSCQIVSDVGMEYPEPLGS